jgi:hypothetical protein
MPEATVRAHRAGVEAFHGSLSVDAKITLEEAERIFNEAIRELYKFEDELSTLCRCQIGEEYTRCDCVSFVHSWTAYAPPETKIKIGR